MVRITMSRAQAHGTGTGVIARALWLRHDPTGTMAQEREQLHWLDGTGTILRARWHRDENSCTGTMARAQSYKHDGTGTRTVALA